MGHRDAQGRRLKWSRERKRAAKALRDQQARSLNASPGQPPSYFRISRPSMAGNECRTLQPDEGQSNLCVAPQESQTREDICHAQPLHDAWTADEDYYEPLSFHPAYHQQYVYEREFYEPLRFQPQRIQSVVLVPTEEEAEVEKNGIPQDHCHGGQSCGAISLLRSCQVLFGWSIAPGQCG